MPTLFCVYNLKEKQMTEEYDKYLTDTKIPGIRGPLGVQLLTLGK